MRLCGDRLLRMNSMLFLQPLAPILSAILLATIADIVLRLFSDARDRIAPLLGIPARFAARLEAKLNRKSRPRHVRHSRGLITLGVMVLIGLILGAGLDALIVQAYENNWMIAPVLAPIIWFMCFRLTYVWTAGVDLAKKKAKKGSKPDNLIVADGLKVLARRHISTGLVVKPDRHALARLVIEAAALSVHRGWLAIVLWACAAALIGWSPIVVAVLVVTLLEAERVIATADKLGTPFSQPTEMVEAIINFVPARMAALLFVLAAVFTPAAKPVAALMLMFKQADSHTRYNDGWPVAAVAGALHIALQSGTRDRAWIGGPSATAQLAPKDISRALWLHGVAVALCVLIFTAVLLLSLAA